MTSIFRTLFIVGLLAVPHIAFAQAKPDATTELFKPVGPVPTFKITVDADNLKQMAKDARKYVRATIRVGDQSYADVGLHLKGAAGSRREWNDAKRPSRDRAGSGRGNLPSMATRRLRL